MLVDTLRDQEPGVFRPTITALDEPNLFVTERLAMSGSRVLFIWRTIADVAVQND
jgi:hypothetical protein